MGTFLLCYDTHEERSLALRQTAGYAPAAMIRIAFLPCLMLLTAVLMGGCIGGGGMMDDDFGGYGGFGGDDYGMMGDDGFGGFGFPMWGE